jgi:hypothetical protein
VRPLQILTRINKGALPGCAAPRGLFPSGSGAPIGSKA